MDSLFRRNIPLSNGDVTKENILEMLGTTCGLLEMMLRHDIVDRILTFETVGSTLVLLLLKVIERCMESSMKDLSFIKMAAGSRSRQPKEGSLALKKSLDIIYMFSEIPSFRERLANIPGVIQPILNLARNTGDNELRLQALCTIANLACERENVVMIMEHDDVFKTFVNELNNIDIQKLGNGKNTESYCLAMENATEALGNLLVVESNQNKIASDNVTLKVLLQLFQKKGLSDKMYISLGKCFAYSVQAEENALKVHALKGGIIFSTMLSIASDLSSDQMLACHALETIRHLIVEETSMKLVSTTDLLTNMTEVACMCDANDERSFVATAVLKRISSYFHSQKESSPTYQKKHQEMHSKVIDSLIVVARHVPKTFVGILQLISESLADQTQREENCTAIISHQGIFEALQNISEAIGSLDCDIATATILINLCAVVEDRSVLACEEVPEIIGNLLNRTEFDRDLGQRLLFLINDLTSSLDCIKAMGNNEKLMVGLMKRSVASSNTQDGLLVNNTISILMNKN